MREVHTPFVRALNTLMKIELLYVTDIYCIWCFGFAPVIERLADENADRISVRVVNGGMIPKNTSLAGMFGRFPDPIALHKRVEETSGCAFGPAYLDEVRRLQASSLILNSNIPARAQMAFKLLGCDAPLTVMAELQCAYYHEGRDLQDLATYAPIAAELGVDFEDFRAKFDSPEAAMGVMEDRHYVEQLGVQGFPALILHGPDDRYVMIARGYLPFADLSANLDAALRQNWPQVAAMADAQVCSLDGQGC